MEAELYAQYREIEDTHWWFLGRRRIFSELLDREVPRGPRFENRSVLDIGTGTGAALDYLSRYGATTGLDVDPRAVEYCRDRGIENVVEANPPPLPFADETFSLVTALDVIEHVDDDAELVAEIHRVLRPGGLCLVSVPAFRMLWGIQDEVAHHKRRYRLGEVRDLLEQGGLSIRRITYFNFLLFPPIAAVRLMERVSPRRPPRRSDFSVGEDSPRLNAALTRGFGTESRLLRRMNLPFGVSILALAERPG
jgi:SAM-dependent methyltransferase